MNVDLAPRFADPGVDEHRLWDWLQMSAIEQRQTLPAQSRDILNWITGTGLLVVNAALFFAALVIMIPWNLYSDPGDLWVADPLRKWAFVLAFHALVVGALVAGSVSPRRRHVFLEELDRERQMVHSASSSHVSHSNRPSFLPGTDRVFGHGRGLGAQMAGRNRSRCVEPRFRSDSRRPRRNMVRLENDCSRRTH